MKSVSSTQMYLIVGNMFGITLNTLFEMHKMFEKKSIQLRNNLNVYYIPQPCAFNASLDNYYVSYSASAMNMVNMNLTLHKVVNIRENNTHNTG